MEDKYYISGSVGPFIDDRPLLTHARIKPYVVAILMHRGAVRSCEVVSALIPHCAEVDTKIGMWDGVEGYENENRPRVDILVEEVLGEMVFEGILRYNETCDLWVLSLGAKRQNLPRIINWMSAMGGQLPPHLLIEMSRDEIIRTKKTNA